MAKRTYRITTSGSILKQMRDALQKFGVHVFEDKGPAEVMKLQPIVDSIAAMPADEARTILEAVHADGDHGSIVARYIVSALDGQPDAWWERLMKSPILTALY